MDNKELLNQTIEKVLHRILIAQGIAIPEKTKVEFECEEVRKGSHIRTYAYIIKVTKPSSMEIFCKEYLREETHERQGGIKEAEKLLTLAGTTKLIVDEKKFSEMLVQVRGFVPWFLEEDFFIGLDGNAHHLKFMEKYDYTLEEKLVALYEKKKEALGKRDNVAIESIEQEAGDWLRRFSDIVMVNNLLLNLKYKIEDLKPRVRRFDSTDFSFDLITYLNIILQKLIPDRKERETWKVRKRYDKIIGILIDEVTEHIKKYSGNELSIFGEHPAHCLYKSSVELEKPVYVPDSILRIRDGKPKEETPYNGFAICDLTKIADYPEILGQASLYTDPTVTRVLPKNKIKPMIETGALGGILDHLIVSKKRIVENRDKHLMDISKDEQRIFLDIYSRASIWAYLRKMYFISSLETARLKELVETHPAHNPPEDFVRECIHGVLDVYDPAGNFGFLKEGFKDLEKDLTRQPYTKSIDEFKKSLQKTK